jgi:hypothetical protein
MQYKQALRVNRRMNTADELSPAGPMDGMLLRGVLERERRRAADEYQCTFEPGRFSLVLDVDPGVRRTLRRKAATSASGPFGPFGASSVAPPAADPFGPEAVSKYLADQAVAVAASEAEDERERVTLNQIVTTAAAAVSADIASVTAQPDYDGPAWGRAAYKVNVQGTFASEPPEDLLTFYDDLIRELKRHFKGRASAL